MTKDILEIDDLTRGINDPDMILSDRQKDAADEWKHKGTADSCVSHEGDLEKYWQDFLSCVETDEKGNDKTDRLVCKLDRDLADSLDDCDIHNRCRSDLVNAIVRSFFGAFLPRLAQYRREKKSLFTNFKET